MFWGAVFVILLISFVWAVWSLRRLSIKKDIEETKENLKKGRVVYKA